MAFLVLCIICIVLSEWCISVFWRKISVVWPAKLLPVISPSGQCNFVCTRSLHQQLVLCCENVAGRVGVWIVLALLKFVHDIRLSDFCVVISKRAAEFGACGLFAFSRFCAFVRNHWGAVIWGIGIAFQLDRMEDFSMIYDAGVIAVRFFRGVYND